MMEYGGVNVIVIGMRFTIYLYLVVDRVKKCPF